MSEGKTPIPPANSFFTPCFLSFTFSFYPLFHFALVCALLPSPLGSRAFPFAPGSFSNRNKSFTGRSKSVHISGGEIGYTKHVDKGSRNPEADDLPIFLFLFFTPFYFVNDGKRPELVPPRAGVFFCPFEGKCALIVAPALLIIFQRLFKNGSHIGAESAVY